MSLDLRPATVALIAQCAVAASRSGLTAMMRAELACAALGQIQRAQRDRILRAHALKDVEASAAEYRQISIDHRAYAAAAVAELERLMDGQPDALSLAMAAE